MRLFLFDGRGEAAVVPDHADAAHRDEHGKNLPGLVVKSGGDVKRV